jgi:hypothetical protein
VCLPVPEETRFLESRIQCPAAATSPIEMRRDEGRKRHVQKEEENKTDVSEMHNLLLSFELAQFDAIPIIS